MYLLDPLQFPLKHALRSQWHALVRSANLSVAVLTPTSYTRGARAAAAQRLCLAAWQPLVGFLLGSALLCIALAHIVRVAAANYGLSHLAVAATTRILLIELMPLGAALFVTMRSLPEAADQFARPVDAHHQNGLEPALAFAVGNALAVWVLATAGCAISLISSFFVIHGGNYWALKGYARDIGEIFDLPTCLGMLLKVVAFSGVVALAPVATPQLHSQTHASRTLSVGARTLSLLLLVEIVALAAQNL